LLVVVVEAVAQMQHTMVVLVVEAVAIFSIVACQ
jgi:hypothetical protein